jgi:DNA-binding CsgD family transcriptional regulator
MIPTPPVAFDLTSFRNLWKSDLLESEIGPIEELIRDNPLLNDSMLIRDSVLGVVDHKNMVYSCMYGDAEKICGWSREILLSEGVGFYVSKLPDPDYQGLEEMTRLMTRYVIALPDDKARKFQVIFDYRIVHPDGSIHRIVQEGNAHKRDTEGNILVSINIISDISNMKREGRQHLRLTDGRENLIYEVDNTTGRCQRLENLSGRELEVARLMGQRLSSGEIAQKLFLSAHTVDTHRRNMLRKCGMADTTELLNFLRVYRLI